MLEIKKSNTLTEIKNAFNGIISRFNTDMERISELEHRKIENIQTDTQRGKRMKITKQNISELQSDIKIYNMRYWNTRRRRGQKR